MSSELEPKPHKLDRPHVLRSAGPAVSTIDLPQGAVLHGAEKLRLAKLDGSGVRVGIIDSGIDKDHPGFDGKVVVTKWYRAGTPLSEDDHGKCFVNFIILSPFSDNSSLTLIFVPILILHRYTCCGHYPLSCT